METRSNARINAQALQIKQLQTDVAEIKSNLKLLEEEKAESVEFRKVLLGWIKQQERKSEDASCRSRFSGETFSTSASRSAPSDTPFGLPWPVQKIQLPEFSGLDPQDWIQKAELYFDINNTPDHVRLRLARLRMVGVAQLWFTVITQVHDSLSWTDFQSELLQRFSGLEIHNPFEQLTMIKQGDSIHDSIDDYVSDDVESQVVSHMPICTQIQHALHVFDEMPDQFNPPYYDNKAATKLPVKTVNLDFCVGSGSIVHELESSILLQVLAPLELLCIGKKNSSNRQWKPGITFTSFITAMEAVLIKVKETWLDPFDWKPGWQCYWGSMSSVFIVSVRDRIRVSGFLTDFMELQVVDVLLETAICSLLLRPTTIPRYPQSTLACIWCWKSLGRLLISWIYLLILAFTYSLQLYWIGRGLQEATWVSILVSDRVYVTFKPYHNLSVGSHQKMWAAKLKMLAARFFVSGFHMQALRSRLYKRCLQVGSNQCWFISFVGGAWAADPSLEDKTVLKGEVMIGMSYEGKVINMYS